MGYPMTWGRVVNRNRLQGNYRGPLEDPAEEARALLAGDLRRLELNQRDERHLKRYAERADITERQAMQVLSDLFSDFGTMPIQGDQLAGVYAGTDQKAWQAG